MKKALCVLTLLGIVAAARAEVDIRIWLTTQNPMSSASTTTMIRGRTIGSPATSYYGPFTPWATATNDSGAYDVRHNDNSAIADNGDLRLNTSNQKFSLSNLAAAQPTGLAQGTPVYIWATFCGAGTQFVDSGEVDANGDPIFVEQPLAAPFPGGGWAPSPTKINGMNLQLVTTGSLAIDPHWYEVTSGTGSATAYRWETTSDMTGDTVTLAGVQTSGFTNNAVDTDRMQNNLVPSNPSAYATAAILLGAINVTGGGDLYVGIGYNGISVGSAAEKIPAVYFPGTADTGILADTQPQAGYTPRHGASPSASWVPEPASLLLIGLGALVLRRR